MTFASSPTRSGPIFLAVSVLAGAAAVFLASLIPEQPTWAGTFWLLVGLLAALVIMITAIYWAIIAYKLYYHLNRNGLAIQWGLTRQRIPFNQIKAVIPGREVADITALKAMNVAGLHFGRSLLPDYGPVRIFGTAPAPDSVLVVTPFQSYLISPQSPEHFMAAWQARQNLGPTQPWTESVQRSWPMNLPFLTDPLAWGMAGAAIMAYLAMFGYLAQKFPELPASLPIHFNALGQPDRIADKSALFTLVTAGGLILVLNAVIGSFIYRRERVAAYLLWATAVMVQFLLWGAMIALTA
jgi:hypothetical protein